MSKLDESMVKWIIRDKHKGSRNKQIAETAGVSIRWVQRLWARYKDSPNIMYLMSMGRPVNGLPGRREHSSVLTAKNDQRGGARMMEEIIEEETGIHIPHNTLLMDNGLASELGKRRRRKWIRYERMHSMWHTDYKQLDDGSYEDDASRFVTGWGVFGEATTENAITTEAIKRHGKPASIMADHSSMQMRPRQESPHTRRDWWSLA